MARNTWTRRATFVAIAASAGCFTFIDASHYDLGNASLEDVGADVRDVAVSDVFDVFEASQASEVSDASVDASMDAAAFSPPPYPLTWTSPNGATWMRTDAGIRITTSPSNDHAILTPTPPLLAAKVFTVRATVRMPATLAEVGLVARLQDGGAGVFSSSLGGMATPFLGVISDKDWNVEPGPVLGEPYSFLPFTLYHLEIAMGGSQASAKLWLEGDPVPPKYTMQATFRAPFDVGGAVGFYVFSSATSDGFNVVLESLSVTSP